ncbi:MULTISPECIES: O-antigen ligase family protein [Pseudomonas]|uniref:O-antigen ligase family protein n=1 Tax=Pseudomonas TaxID=286 RepID=UPI003008C425
MHKSSVVPVIAALVAFLSVSTMLRFPGLPVGIGEVIVVLAACVFLRRGNFLQNLKHPLMLFWFAFIATAIVGYLVRKVQGEGTIHTSIAYIYAAGFTLIVLAYVGDLDKLGFQRFIRAMGTIPVLLLAIPLFIFLIGSVWLSDMLEINTTFYPSRVAAWSTNPNQLALFLLPVPIWLAAIYQNTQWQGLRLFKKFFFLWFFFFLGFCVRSDALLLAWCIGLPLLTGMAWWWLGRMNWKFFATMLAAFVLAFGSFKFFFDGPGQQFFQAMRADMVERLASHEPEKTDDGTDGKRSALYTILERAKALAPQTAGDVEHPLNPGQPTFGRSDSALGIGMDPNKAGVRKTLWIHALEVWKLSPIVGHGPGAFSYLDSPEQRQEAHNLLLDMLTQVGIVGVLLFAALYLWLMAGAIKARDPYSITLLVILMVFSGAHFMLRQPVFTLYMVMCAVIIRNRLFGLERSGLGKVDELRPLH